MFNTGFSKKARSPGPSSSTSCHNTGMQLRMLGTRDGRDKIGRKLNAHTYVLGRGVMQPGEGLIKAGLSGGQASCQDLVSGGEITRSLADVAVETAQSMQSLSAVQNALDLQLYDGRSLAYGQSLSAASLTASRVAASRNRIFQKRASKQNNERAKLPADSSSRSNNLNRLVENRQSNTSALTSREGNDGCSSSQIIDPQARLDYWWSFIVSTAWLYNFWIIIYRTAFCDPVTDSPFVWIIPDYTADLVYLIDIALQFRTSYLEEGVLVKDNKMLVQHYIHSKRFYIDCLTVLPVDFLYLKFGLMPPIRLLRLLKTRRFFTFIDRTERHTNSPNAIRLVKLALYLIAILHWNACIYHIFATCTSAFSDGNFDGGGESNYLCKSESPIINTTAHRSANSTVHEYLHAFYWSAMFIIGQHPRPTTPEAYVFVIVEVLLGLLLFATVLGHITQIVASFSSDRKEFQGRLDAVKVYMRLRRVPKALQDRVIKWFDYLWICKRTADEEKVLSLLPEKLRADIAVHVHLETLKSVDFFQNSEEGFLSELVLKLRPVLYSPGDYICKKNEIGKEMYIVTKGKLHVLADDGVTVFAVLKPGKYFGEISILNAAVGNRRTATVRSVGYSDLFCLSKQNLWDVLKDYPTERARLEAIAAKRMVQFHAHNQQVLQTSRESIARSASVSEARPTNNSSKHTLSNSSVSLQPRLAQVAAKEEPIVDEAEELTTCEKPTKETPQGKRIELSDQMAAELNRLLTRIQYLETENAALNVRVSNQEFSLLRRMDDLELRFRNQFGTRSSSTSDELVSPNIDFVPPHTCSIQIREQELEDKQDAASSSEV